MAKKKKYYVVWVGVNPGIYDSWDTCNLQIKGYPGAKYKSFKSKEEAEAAYSGHFSESIKKKTGPTKKVEDLSFSDEIVWDSMSVDAACSGNPGKMEYRGVNTKNKDEIFHQGPFDGGTNNVGEFLALVHALAYLKENGDDKLTVYSDSRIAMGWVAKKKSRTKLKRTTRNSILFKMIERAEIWLASNTYNNKILKWETKRWGEIPADFGRK